MGKALAEKSVKAPSAVTADTKTRTLSAADNSTPTADNADQLVELQEFDDLWARIRAGYAMPTLDSHLVEVHERWFMRNPEYVENMVSRARYYL